jgi:hypothetical protein
VVNGPGEAQPLPKLLEATCSSISRCEREVKDGFDKADLILEHLFRLQQQITFLWNRNAALPDP